MFKFIFISFLSTSEGLAEALRSVASSQLWNFIGFSAPRSSFLSVYSQESTSQLNSFGMNCEEDEVKRYGAAAKEISMFAC